MRVIFTIFWRLLKIGRKFTNDMIVLNIITDIFYVSYLSSSRNVVKVKDFQSYFEWVEAISFKNDSGDKMKEISSVHIVNQS